MGCKQNCVRPVYATNVAGRQMKNLPCKNQGADETEPKATGVPKDFGKADTGGLGGCACGTRIARH